MHTALLIGLSARKSSKYTDNLQLTHSHTIGANWWSSVWTHIYQNEVLHVADFADMLNHSRFVNLCGKDNTVEKGIGQERRFGKVLAWGP